MKIKLIIIVLISLQLNAQNTEEASSCEDQDKTKPTIENHCRLDSIIDTKSTELSKTYTEEYDRLPVARNLTDISLLAPGTTLGDEAFGNFTTLGRNNPRNKLANYNDNLASFGGSSVAENSYYINGFNVTNFRNGLGSSTVPFEFYKEIKVVTGGYGIEYGHVTGGVIDATTKSGTNEWKFGLGAHYITI